MVNLYLLVLYIIMMVIRAKYSIVYNYSCKANINNTGKYLKIKLNYYNDVVCIE